MAAVTYLEAIRQGIWEEMERDSSVFVLGEDVGIYGGAFKLTEGMLERFGEDRVVDTPISESAIVGAAIGAALMGMRPIADVQYGDHQQTNPPSTIRSTPVQKLAAPLSSSRSGPRTTSAKAGSAVMRTVNPRWVV